MTWQLPVPAAVLTLMYHERLLPCYNNSPRLLDGNSPSNASSRQDSGQGTVCMFVFVVAMFILKRRLSITLPLGHGSVFVCCNTAKLWARPATFFILHALGGAILFLTDGIIVRLHANTTYHS